MEKPNKVMKKLWREPIVLLFILFIIAFLFVDFTILSFVLFIAIIIFFGFLFYYSWFQPKKLIQYYSTHGWKKFGDLNESRIFIPFMRFCAIIYLPLFSWFLYDLITN